MSRRKGRGPALGTIHHTRDYHRHGNIELATELTVCESLGSPASPYSKALGLSKPYGALVGDFLAHKGLLRPGARILEIGGGYGTLMKGLLSSHSPDIEHITMADLSPGLLERQKAALSAWNQKIAFCEGDALEIIETIRDVDLVIVNEVMGDLETVVNIDPRAMPDPIRDRVGRYGLEIPAARVFHFNIGAVQLVEALCRKGVAAFLSEHCSDPLFPAGMDYLAAEMESDGYPREIPLKDHSEYTIRFSHLLRTAAALGRRSGTGPLMDVTGMTASRRFENVFRWKLIHTDEHEVLHELLDHIREYRWLTLEA